MLARWSVAEAAEDVWKEIVKSGKKRVVTLGCNFVLN